MLVVKITFRNKKLFCVFFFGPFNCELQGVKSGSQQRENLVLLQFSFDKSENESQVAEISNGVYGADAVTSNYVQFWFRFHSGIFDVNDAPRTGKPVVENVEKITEIIEAGRLVSSRSISQGLKIDHKTVLCHLRKVEFKKKFYDWVPHQLTPKT
ncbi:histone-lysine N-methyltransferase SETMAR [Trichonephila clavipes]|nr:histone-lysine N-methyltransferase SETMAR [Trichonephila clavipes]